MDVESRSRVRTLPSQEILALACRQLEDCGVPAADARVVADSLVQTSLWGIDSHGIARLPHYLRRLQAGSIESRPEMRFRRTGPCTGQLDGSHGLGILVCHRAMQEAIALAKENGAGIVGCSHSTHCGAIGLYGRQAASEGLIGLALTHSDAYVVPASRQVSPSSAPTPSASPCPPPRVNRCAWTWPPAPCRSIGS